MAQKPSIPKGTRDFSPIEMARRNYIFNTIKDVFLLYGFQQIETPAIENLSTLMGKYGEEGDKLLFKILNSGDYLKDAPDDLLAAHDSLHLTTKISEKGLRYDLTVPFARYVVQHRNDVQMPFKRYQVQPVWRADRPQKGRYREFYQCDADIVGSDSLWNEVELVTMIDEVFNRFNINVAIKLNNRKILSGIAEVIGAADKIIDITVAIDKLDKIGIDNVNAELKEKGLSDEAIATLQPLLALDGTNEERLTALAGMLASSEVGMKGIEEMRYVLTQVAALGTRAHVELDVSLARGLNYYTGTILEVKALDVAIGSITGGGRYDNLTGVFGMPGLSGVGISFGADRIYDVLEGLNLFPETMSESTKVIFLNFGKNEEKYCLKYLNQVRKHGINAEIYPDAAKIQKQMKYADQRHIPIVVIAGESEVAEQKFTVKWMKEGKQETVEANKLVETILNLK